MDNGRVASYVQPGGERAVFDAHWSGSLAGELQLDSRIGWRYHDAAAALEAGDERQAWAITLNKIEQDLLEADCLNQEAAILEAEADHSPAWRASPLRAEAVEVRARAERLRDRAKAILTSGQDAAAVAERRRATLEELKGEFEFLKTWFAELGTQRPCDLADYQCFRSCASAYRAQLRAFRGAGPSAPAWDRMRLGLHV